MMRDRTEEDTKHDIALLREAGCDVAEPAVQEALRRGLDVDKIANVYESRARYEGAAPFRAQELALLHEFDAIVEYYRAPKRMAVLEAQVGWLLQLADSTRSPFYYFLVEIGATKAQELALHRMMDDITRMVLKNEEIVPAQIERRVSLILGRSEGEGHILAASIINALQEEGKYTKAIAALKATDWY